MTLTVTIVRRSTDRFMPMPHPRFGEQFPSLLKVVVTHCQSPIRVTKKHEKFALPRRIPDLSGPTGTVGSLRLLVDESLLLEIRQGRGNALGGLVSSKQIADLRPGHPIWGPGP